MLKYLKSFNRDSEGAVTVDWVVLTAAMVSFGIAVASIITTAANDPADGIGAELAAMEIN